MVDRSSNKALFSNCNKYWKKNVLHSRIVYSRNVLHSTIIITNLERTVVAKNNEKKYLRIMNNLFYIICVIYRWRPKTAAWSARRRWRRTSACASLRATLWNRCLRTTLGSSSTTPSIMSRVLRRSVKCIRTIMVFKNNHQSMDDV